ALCDASTEGRRASARTPAAPRPGAQASLLRVLQKQGVEISRATAPFTVTVPGKRGPARQNPTTNTGAGGAASGGAARHQRRTGGGGGGRGGGGGGGGDPGGGGGAGGSGGPSAEAQE